MKLEIATKILSLRVRCEALKVGNTHGSSAESKGAPSTWDLFSALLFQAFQG